jgi:hypothetical protein
VRDALSEKIVLPSEPITTSKKTYKKSKMNPDFTFTYVDAEYIYAELNQAIIADTIQLSNKDVRLDTYLFTAPHRFFFEKIQVKINVDFNKFIYKFLMRYHDKKENNKKAFFIKSLQIEKTEYKNVILLFVDAPHEFELYVLNQAPNTYEKITASAIYDYGSNFRVQKQGVNLSSSDIVTMLKSYKSSNLTQEKTYDKLLQEALGVPVTSN